MGLIAGAALWYHIAPAKADNGGAGTGLVEPPLPHTAVFTPYFYHDESSLECTV